MVSCPSTDVCNFITCRVAHNVDVLMNDALNADANKDKDWRTQTIANKNCWQIMRFTIFI